MKQSALDRRVAQATGESVRLIRQRGFSLLLRPSIELSDKPSNLQNKASLPARKHVALATA